MTEPETHDYLIFYFVSGDQLFERPGGRLDSVGESGELDRFGIAANPGDGHALVAAGAHMLGGHDVELPLGDVQRVVFGRVSAGLHREDEHVGAHLGLGAQLIGVLVPRARGNPTEVQSRMLRLGPDLQVAGGLDLDAHPAAGEHVVLSHPLRRTAVRPSAVATRNSASTPRTVLSRRSENAQRQKSTTVASRSANASVPSSVCGRAGDEPAVGRARVGHHATVSPDRNRDADVVRVPYANNAPDTGRCSQTRSFTNNLSCPRPRRGTTVLM